MSLVLGYASDEDSDVATASTDVFAISTTHASKPTASSVLTVAKIESSAPDVLAEVSLVNDDVV